MINFQTPTQNICGFPRRLSTTVLSCPPAAVPLRALDSHTPRNLSLCHMPCTRGQRSRSRQSPGRWLRVPQPLSSRTSCTQELSTCSLESTSISWGCGSPPHLQASCKGRLAPPRAAVPRGVSAVSEAKVLCVWKHLQGSWGSVRGTSRGSVKGMGCGPSPAHLSPLTLLVSHLRAQDPEGGIVCFSCVSGVCILAVRYTISFTKGLWWGCIL